MVLRSRARQEPRRASAAVEMAIVLTFIFGPATYGMIEMSRAIQVKEFLTGTARSAGTVAIKPGGDNAAVTANVTSSLTAYGIDPTLATTTVKVNGVAVDVSTAVAGDQISIKIALPAAQVNWMLPMFLSNSSVESETLIMMRQGSA
jgi:Flp pilus assembly protein TadG